jgi:hypothetical protein
VGLVDMAGVMWLQRRRPGVQAPDGLLARLGDGFGVAWLQRRTCIAAGSKEVLDV